MLHLVTFSLVLVFSFITLVMAADLIAEGFGDYPVRKARLVSFLFSLNLIK